ncbi:MAG: hypothetical protein FWG30_04500, partial [Eubacteriaceae bacterium]|nr:hypothetical protein [Eubacteriaceae bacterium]
ISAAVGDQVTIAAGTDDGQLDRFMPASGYASGVQQGTVPYIVVARNNTINVIYKKAAASVKVTVNYYKGDSSSAPIGTFEIDANVGDEIVIPSGTNDGQLDKYKPQSGYVSGVQDGTPYIVVEGDNIIKVVYAKAEKADVAISVKYYKDSASQANLLGTSSISAAVGDQVTIAAGTDDGQLDRFMPASGYASGVQQGTVPYIVVARNNTISVVYKKATVKVTVNYYNDDTSSDPIGTIEIDAKAGDEIVIPAGTGDGQLDRFKPQSGYSSGVQTGTKPYIVVAGENIVNIVYSKQDVSVTVNYFKDAVGRTPIGTCQLSAKAGDSLTLADGTDDGQLDCFIPASGYTSGVQQGSVPYTVVAGTNVINVVYNKTAVKVIINYYLDDISTEPIGTLENDANIGDEIVLNSRQLDRHIPSKGYNSGVQSGSKPYIVVEGENIIKVVYSKSDVSVTIKYHKDTVGNEPIGTYEVSAKVADQITIAAGSGDGQLDAFKPSGYTSGVQQDPVPYIVISGRNTINVVYKKAAAKVTVEYYEDSTSGEPIGTIELDASVGDEIELNATQLGRFRPDRGYNNGVQTGSKPYIVVEGDNNIKVVYSKTDVSVTVNYYKDAIGGTPIGTCELSALEGDSITLAPGKLESQLDFFKPQAGYFSGEQLGSVPYTVVAGKNTINVVYMKSSAKIKINYYRDSTSSPSIGSAEIEAGIGNEIVLSKGTGVGQLDMFRPYKGYLNGVQEGSVPYIVLAGDNTINVVYLKNTVTVTIQYYVDDVSLKPIGTSTIEAQVGDKITIAAGTGTNKLDMFRPAIGYGKGTQLGVKPYVVVSGTNVINVIYIKDTADIKICYYKDHTNSKPIGECTVKAKVGCCMSVLPGKGNGCLDMFKPSGYQCGVQAGAKPYKVIAGCNEIKVVYCQTPIVCGSYVVNCVDKATGKDIIKPTVCSDIVPGKVSIAPTEIDGFKPVSDCSETEIKPRVLSAVTFYYDSDGDGDEAPFTSDATSVAAYALASIASLGKMLSLRKKARQK